MSKNKYYLILCCILNLFFSCKSTLNSVVQKTEVTAENKIELINTSDITTIDDSTFVNIKDFNGNFMLDMKYATTDNFLKTKVYDCASCYLRFKTVRSLIAANNEFKLKGFSIKIFDCYRPIDVQKEMWKLVPDANYVADPKKGSIHNRGGAVDITLIDKNGIELDMGTTFDFFGPESSHNYEKVSEEVKKNRAYLKQVMLKNNFKSFDSEWWHYNLIDSQKDAVANFKWKCD